MINKLRKQKIIALREELKKLLEECQHEPIENGCGSAVCSICGATFSWYCPTSPTLECDYYHQDRDEFDFDDCIYCGHPEERK